MQQPVLTIENACKSYGSTNALRGITLQLYSGELLGFLGPNGAGKTTLIRCLSGRSILDEGAFEFGRINERKVTMGVVPQNLAIYDDMTTEQNLWAFGKLHAVPRSELSNRIAFALKWSNLSERRNHLVKSFSGGMKRRLNIACSVLHEPGILLLDEPTVGVDPQSRERIYEMLSELRGQGTGILLTTHQLDEAQFRCDRIAIVDQGRVIRTGTFDELRSATVGTSQQLHVRFNHFPEEDIAPLVLDDTNLNASCEISNHTNELMKVLSNLHDTEQLVDQIVLQSPTLQDVFLHLTGKELRE